MRTRRVQGGGKPGGHGQTIEQDMAEQDAVKSGRYPARLAQIIWQRCMPQSAMPRPGLWQRAKLGALHHELQSGITKHRPRDGPVGKEPRQNKRDHYRAAATHASGRASPGKQRNGEKRAHLRGDDQAAGQSGGKSNGRKKKGQSGQAPSFIDNKYFVMQSNGMEKMPPTFLPAVKKKSTPHALRSAPVLRDLPHAPIEARFALLVNPFYPKDPNASFGKHVLTPSLALTSFAAVTPEDWRVQYCDENLLHGAPPAAPTPQVVGISVHLTFARRAFEIARWYRARGAKVVMGGLHVLSCPEECAPHADALAVGDGVQLWPQILRDAAANQLKPRYVATYENQYAEDPPARRSLLPRKNFLTTASLIATRGCHNRCGFCYLATEGLRMPYRMKRPEDVAAEFAAEGQPYGVFIDNNLGSRRDYLHSLCQSLKPLKKIWSAAISIDVTDDAQLVREMALAGCTGVFVGFESLTDENLSDARKKTPRTADYARRVRMLHDNGIQVNASFVFGFDHDRKTVFQQTAEWVEENRLECSTFHILTPYPATPLFRQMEAEGRLLHRDWELYDTAHAVFQPKYMSPEELEHGYAWTYQRLFSNASIWRRRPRDRRAVAAYMAMSYLYKRSNPLWHFLIKHDLVQTVWRPLIELSRWRQLSFRGRLEAAGDGAVERAEVVSAGV